MGERELSPDFFKKMNSRREQSDEAIGKNISGYATRERELIVAEEEGISEKEDDKLSPESGALGAFVDFPEKHPFLFRTAAGLIIGTAIAGANPVTEKAYAAESVKSSVSVSDRLLPGSGENNKEMTAAQKAVSDWMVPSPEGGPPKLDNVYEGQGRYQGITFYFPDPSFNPGAKGIGNFCKENEILLKYSGWFKSGQVAMVKNDNIFLFDKTQYEKGGSIFRFPKTGTPETIGGKSKILDIAIDGGEIVLKDIYKEWAYRDNDKKEWVYKDKLFGNEWSRFFASIDKEINSMNGSDLNYLGIDKNDYSKVLELYKSGVKDINVINKNINSFQILPDSRGNPAVVACGLHPILMDSLKRGVDKLNIIDPDRMQTITNEDEVKFVTYKKEWFTNDPNYTATFLRYPFGNVIYYNEDKTFHGNYNEENLNLAREYSGHMVASWMAILVGEGDGSKFISEIDARTPMPDRLDSNNGRNKALYLREWVKKHKDQLLYVVGKTVVSKEGKLVKVDETAYDVIKKFADNVLGVEEE